MSLHEFPHTEITRSIIGSAMKVHACFGMGFPEIIYNRALRIELERTGLHFEIEAEKHIYYNGVLVGKRRLDIIVEAKILVELKAVYEVDRNNFKQVLNYLKIFGLDVGLLLNFGAESLYFKRFALSGSNL